MRKRILSFLLALSMVVSLLPAGAFAQGSNGLTAAQSNASSTELVMEYGKPKVDGMESESDGVTYKGDGWTYDSTGNGTLTLTQTAAGVSNYDFGKVCPTRSDSEDTRYTVDCAVVVGKNVTITGGRFYYYKGVGVINNGTIAGGKFDEDVTNNVGGIISGGTFEKTVTNNGTISGGVFFSFSRYSNVVNEGAITGGIFQWGLNAESTGTVTGGFFGSKTGLPDNFHKISMNSGIICKVGDVSWGDHDTLYTVKDTQVQLTTGGEIEKVTGNTTGEIAFTQNDDYNVTFTMPDEDVVLKQKSSGSGELVMDERGYPVGNAGDGWTYESTRLYLTSGSYDFSYLNPTNPETGKEQQSRINVAMVVGENVTITGGNFWDVTNYGTISNGIFSDVTNAGTINGGSFSEVTNTSSGTITDGSVNGIFTNYGRITGGTFERNVINHSTIEDGTFNGWFFNYGVVENGVFTSEVENYADGNIKGGIFTYGRLSNSGAVTGGYFKYNYDLPGTFHKVTVESGSISKVFAKTPDGKEYSADWNNSNLYTVQGSTVTLKADGNIESVKKGNGGTIDFDYPDKNDKSTATFTMPDEDVVLDRKDYRTELVMDSKTGKPDTNNVRVENGVYVGDGWKYDGETLTLTQTAADSSTDDSTTYDFTKTKPQSGEGETLGEVNVKVVIDHSATVTGGIFKDEVTNKGVIDGGTFKKQVNNGTDADYGIINGGIFEEQVKAYSGGCINGGIFAAGLTADSGCSMLGGYFNGNNGLDADFHNVSVMDGKILKVSGVKPTGSDGWNLYVAQGIFTAAIVTLTADGNIESVKGKTSGKIITPTYPDENDKSTVTFTMPNEDVLLEKAHRTELVIKEDDGKPDTDGVKQNSDGTYVGDGWEYDDTTLTLTANPTGKDGWDFSGDAALQCEVEVGQGATIKGGTFEKTVKNYGYIDGGTFNGAVINYGTINDGTFNDKGQVINDSDGVINGGTFEGEVVNNYGTIEDGTYNGSVENNGKIVSGTFKANVVNGANGVIDNAIFTKTSIIYNYGTISGQRAEYYGDLNNLPGGTITGGIFAAGLSSNTGTVNGGYFANGANLPNSFYSISVQGGKLLEIDGVDLRGSVLSGWDKCWTCRTDVQITADVNITNINSEKIGEGTTYQSDYVNGDKKTVKFTKTSGENVVLNKNRTDGVLVMDPATGLPKVDDMEPETDGTYKTYKGNGWEYDADNKVLTLHGTYTGNVSYAYYDFTSTKPTHKLNEKGDGLVPQVNCEIVAEGGVQSSAGEPYSSYIVILNGGTFKEKVTLKGATSSDPSSAQSIISAGTFENEVEVCPGAEIDGGTYTETSVINNKGFITLSVGSVSGALNNLDGGFILDGTFDVPVTNDGIIYGGVFYAPIENNGTITGGIFFDALAGDVRGGVLLLSAEETPAGTHRVTMDGDAKFVRVFSGIEEYPFGTVVAYLVNADKLDGKNVYAYKGTRFGVALDQEITNLNGKAVGTIYESCYPWGKDPEGSVIEDKTGVCFTMPGEDVVLNKAEEPAPKPDEPGKDDPKAAEYTIKVDEYAKVNGKSSVTVKAGDTVSLTVSETPDGQTFDHWDLPSELQEALTKQDSTFNNSVKDLSFRMPDMGDTDAAFSIKTGFRSAELPADDSAPSALGTAAIVAVGGATAGILVWQGVSLGVDSYLQLSLPDGVAIPTNRRELVTLLWETAGKPEVALPALYNDVPAEDLALQKASRWAVANGLVGDADDEDASRFDPDHYVTKMDVFGAWLKLQKLLKNK